MLYLGFWLMESTYREQGDVHFKHQFILLVRSVSVDSIIGYSTFSNFNILLGDKLRIPTIQVRKVDIFNYRRQISLLILSEFQRID